MKTVRLTVEVMVHDEKALERHVRRLLGREQEVLEHVLGRHMDRVAGFVAEALVECEPPPLDYGVEIRSIRAEAVKDDGRWPKGG